MDKLPGGQSGLSLRRLFVMMTVVALAVGLPVSQRPAFKDVSVYSGTQLLYTLPAPQPRFWGVVLVEIVGVVALLVVCFLHSIYRLVKEPRRDDA